MSSNTVEEIKQRLGILELIESYIKVEKAGSNFRALCPFHNEKTPSFYISPDRDSYYCFGCGAKGDIFSFVQEFEGLDFLGALKLLAERTGVEIVYEKNASKDEKDILFKILEKTTLFLENNLQKSTQTKDYLLDRGLTEETIKKWRLGYVPDGWSNIYDYLKKEGFKPEDIEKAGLVKRKEGGDYYDRFRERVMFPIFDASSRVVGFSGRTLKKDPESGSGQVQEAKYINSPETLLFNKSQILFGYNFAKQSMRKNNFSILVEGQFDVVLSHQAGYANAVATSGTALSEYQVDLLKRMSDRLVIAMDGDGAGFRASQKVWKMALEKGMDVKIASMDGVSDPADIVRDNPDNWKKIIKDSVHIIDFLISRIKNKNHTDERSLKKEISSEVIPYIFMLPSKIEQSHFVTNVSSVLAVSEDIVWHEVENYQGEDVYDNAPEYDSSTEKVNKADRFASVKQLSGIILWLESMKNQKVDTGKLKSDLKNLLGDKNLKTSLNPSNKEELIFETEKLYGNEDNLDRVTNDLLKMAKKRILEYKRELLKKKLKEAEISGNTEQQKEILQKIQDVSKELELVVTSD